MLNLGLDGKTALVTGANHGIGAAIVRALAAQGMRVGFTYYRPPTDTPSATLEAARAANIGGEALIEAQQQRDGEALAAELRAAGHTVQAWEVDFTDAASIPPVFEQTEAACGPVEVLICNHTLDELESFDPALTDSPQGAVRFISAEVIDQHFAVNARASALLIAEYAQRHVARGADWGRVVSIGGAAAHAFNVSYAASKQALASYSQSAALELGRYGVTVNVIIPGPTQTGYITPEEAPRLIAGTPLGRVGLPGDIADAVLLFVSAQAGWLTGQLVHAGGGWDIPR